ncbi:MAG: AmiS/UreI family transporter [Anaerolineae bacterium]
MGAIVLLTAAFIFIVDALFLWGKADPKGTAVANVAIGVQMLAMGLAIGFTSGGNAFLMIVCSLAVAFALFYIILGWCLLAGYDLKALGWYCLGCGIWVPLSSLFFYTQGGDPYFGTFAIAWSVIFLAAWVNLIWGNKLAGAIVRWFLLVGSVVTLIIPAYLLITGHWPPF